MEGRHTSSLSFQARISQKLLQTNPTLLVLRKVVQGFQWGVISFAYCVVKYILHCLYAYNIIFDFSSFRKIRLSKIYMDNCKRTQSTSSHLCSSVEAQRMLTPPTLRCFIFIWNTAQQ